MSTQLPIVYAGEPGAFAEDAVLAAFGDGDRRPVGSFREVFGAVTRAGAIAGVVPIENVINGTVPENYDLLLEHELQIVGEVVVPVRLCLAALPGQQIEAIERVIRTSKRPPGGSVPPPTVVATPDDVQRGRRWQIDRGPRRTRRGPNIIAASIEACILALNEMLAEAHWSGATDAAASRRRVPVSAGKAREQRADLDEDEGQPDTVAWFER